MIINDSFKEALVPTNYNTELGTGIVSPELGRGHVRRCHWKSDCEIDKVLGDDEIFYRINSTIPLEGTKNLPAFVGATRAKEVKMQSFLRAGDWMRKLNTLGYLANRYGTAYIYLEIDDKLSDDKPAGQGKIINHRILTPDHLRPDYGFYSTSLTARETDYYILNYDLEHNVRIHKSRILKLVGKPKFNANNNDDGRDTPYWYGSYNAWMSYLEANSSALTLLKDINIGIFKFGGLRELMTEAMSCAEDEKRVTDAIRARLSGLVDSANISRKLIIDADTEDYSFVDRNYGGIKEIIADFRATFTGVCPLPASIIFATSESSSAFSEAGVGDRALLAQLVANWQNAQLIPVIYQLLSTSFKEIHDYDIEFASTMSLTQTEKSALQFENAKSLVSLVQSGILTPEIAARKLSETNENIDYALTEADFKAIVKNAKEMTATPKVGTASGLRANEVTKERNQG
jgi:hypothetical protein